MNINRHNYEEYFILYMDNELGSDERRMVETFVFQHPDLKEELDLLLQYKLLPDSEIIFPGKDDLIKINGATPITLTNYEEWFVLYTDNELDPEQRIVLEKFIAVNPSLQKELTLIQKTKLQPEEIIFSGKESLYRKDEKVISLPMRWWRVAAAVLLFLGLGITTVVVFNNRSSRKNDIVKGVGTEQKTIKENPVITPVKEEITPGNETVVADNVQLVTAPVVIQNNKNTVVNNNKAVVNDNTPSNIPSPVKNNEPVIAINNKSSNNLPQPDNNPNINNNNATKNALAHIKPPKEIITTQQSLTKAPVTNPNEETSPPKNADVSFAKLEESGENKKNRGFLRKLVRTFEKRTNVNATDDDDRLLIGGLSFKVK